MKWRITCVSIFFLIFFSAIVMRLFHWQIVEAEVLRERGLNQYVRIDNVLPKRGDILSSDGFPLATSTTTYYLYANPREVEDATAAARMLAPVIGISQATIAARLSQKDLQWIGLVPQLQREKKEQIESFALKGLGFEETYARSYPEASMAATVLGFVGKDEQGMDTGYAGIEGYYNLQLTGRAGRSRVIHDAIGRPILARTDIDSGRQNGRNLTLTLDRVVQYTLEKKLMQGIEQYGAAAGMAIVLDPKTGGVLGMSHAPGFDPRTYWTYTQETFRNPIVSDIYEPGSTFKPLVMAAALDAGLITPQTRCPTCDKPVVVGDYAIHTWNNKYYPQTTMTEVMQNSDNTGMVYIGQQLGLSTLRSYLESFGIGRRTGIDVQGETEAPMRPAHAWYPIDVATASFGQGISVTPLQLASAFCSIGNKGIRMQPYVVSRIQTPDGSIIETTPKETGRPISEKTAKVMNEILVSTVKKGEAQWTQLKGFRIAGKTGTASIPIAGKYDPSKTIASFIGYAPADSPKFCMLVILNKPTTSIYAAETAAPLFFTIASELLRYYRITPQAGE
jgi:cell division protein FtsI/penicillin-binding protein 2